MVSRQVLPAATERQRPAWLQALERVRTTVQLRQIAAPTVPPAQQGPTVETTIGPYAPMRRGMGSLAKAMSRVIGPH